MGCTHFGLFWPYSNLWRLLAWTNWAWAQCRFCYLTFLSSLILAKNFYQRISKCWNFEFKQLVWSVGFGVCVCVLVSFMRAQWSWDMSLFMASFKKFLPKISECVELGLIPNSWFWSVGFWSVDLLGVCVWFPTKNVEEKSHGWWWWW